MFSTTIKRSVATLGVVAGLLVIAGPASAQVMPGMIGVKAPSKATDPTGTGVSLTLDVAGSEVFELNRFGLTEHEGAAFRGELVGLEPSALGTQVGSEGVKDQAPGPESSVDIVLRIDG
jgi:hypothetical protein